MLKSNSVSDCNRQCNKLLRPVCGTNGRTYSNECRMKQASCLARIAIEVRSNGPCPEEEGAAADEAEEAADDAVKLEAQDAGKCTVKHQSIGPHNQTSLL